jgi:hypothetical protein
LFPIPIECQKCDFPLSKIKASMGCSHGYCKFPTLNTSFWYGIMNYMTCNSSLVWPDQCKKRNSPQQPFFLTMIQEIFNANFFQKCVHCSPQKIEHIPRKLLPFKIKIRTNPNTSLYTSQYYTYFKFYLLNAPKFVKLLPHYTHIPSNLMDDSR